MKKILIIEDEPHYREYIKLALESEDVTVYTAQSGLEAIKTAAAVRPDLIITDWMLQSNVNGLEVVEVVREIVPEVKSILITGFPSVDVKSESYERNIFKFISKPFELNQIRTTVRDALVDTLIPSWTPIVGFAEILPDGTVAYSNQKLQGLMDRNKEGRTNCEIKRLLSLNSKYDWDRYLLPCNRTIYVKLINNNGKRYLLTLDEENFQLRRSKVVLILSFALGLTDVPFRWQKESRIMVIDDEEFFRRMLSSQFEEAGAFCHTAENYSMALNTLRRDPGIKYVILDFDMPDLNVYQGGLGGIIEDLKEINHEIVVIGSSGHSAQEQFLSAGADHFLEKPWFFDDFARII